MSHGWRPVPDRVFGYLTRADFERAPAIFKSHDLALTPKRSLLSTNSAHYVNTCGEWQHVTQTQIYRRMLEIPERCRQVVVSVIVVNCGR
jgi:hypothetical protein